MEIVLLGVGFISMRFDSGAFHQDRSQLEVDDLFPKQTFEIYPM